MHCILLYRILRCNINNVRIIVENIRQETDSESLTDYRYDKINVTNYPLDGETVGETTWLDDLHKKYNKLYVGCRKRNVDSVKNVGVVVNVGDNFGCQKCHVIKRIFSNIIPNVYDNPDNFDVFDVITATTVLTTNVLFVPFLVQTIYSGGCTETVT